MPPLKSVVNGRRSSKSPTCPRSSASLFCSLELNFSNDVDGNIELIVGGLIYCVDLSIYNNVAVTEENKRKLRGNVI